MQIETAKTYAALSRRAAGLIVDELKRRPDLLLCASAGNTPTLTYQLLAAECARRPRLFRRMRVLQLDEWGGLPPDHPGSCAADLQLKLLKPAGIAPSRFHRFRGEASDPEAECGKMSRWLAANGPIDVCLLGLGKNGHVAMNEPASFLIPQAHVARLAVSSRGHSMLAGIKNKPRYGLTLGLADIMGSRKILLLVSGAAKRVILRRTLEAWISTQVPASLLRLHPHLTVLCDRDARSP